MKKMIKKFLLKTILAENLHKGEITHFEKVNGYPTITLGDGTKLSSFADRGLLPVPELSIPAGYQEVALAYVNRYKFPHFSPAENIRTGFLPRKRVPVVIHPQHKNTYADLAANERKVVAEKMALQTGDVVLELGPFIGFGTVQMSRLVGASGRVISVEADPVAFTVLQQNIAQNQLKNVTTLNYAIGDDDKENMPFWKQKNQANSLVELKGATAEMLTMRRITTIIEEEKITPTFLILTINGIELKALQACREYLQSANSLRIITPGWYSDTEGQYGPRIIALLKSLDFTVHHTGGMHIFAYK